MPKTLTGTVVSTKMKDTAVVEIARAFQHKLYKKTLKRHKKYKAHLDGSIQVAEGDVVDIEETRPISKEKHFRVIKKHES